MRIISGKNKGKKIIPPVDENTRPLRDIVKESIFNLVEHSNKFNVALKNSNILDLFSGSGSFGLECISRGAKQVTFIENYKDCILNIHPSLLPKYRGLNTHARVLASDDRIAGCSVHLVTPKLDAGPVLAQAKVLISKNETQDSLAAKILLQEHILYPKALLNFSNQIRNLLEVKNSK